MARWKLTEPHYLNSPDCYWEQTETDRESGKQKRKKYMVPIHLNPNDPSDWNYKSGQQHISQGGNAFTDGDIIVCHEGKGEPRDIVFTGDPTPGMEPIDDEAKKISADMCDKYGWLKPKDERTFADTMLEKLADRSGAIDPNVAEMSKQLGEVMTLLAQVTAQNSALMQQMSQRKF
jgi:hypothetical protein